MIAPTDRPTRVAIYCRVSSTGQEEGYSLESQETACRAYAGQHGLAVVSVAREVWSGGDRHRPELEALLSQVQPGDVVLAYALDRLSRSQVDTAILVDRLETAGASLRLVTEDFEKSATGTFMRNAKAFVAELEREKIRERTQRGRRARVASGKPIPGSKPPFGYAWVDAEKARLALDPDTTPIVRDMFDLALAGSSLRAIAASLDARGIATPYGAEHWSAGTVRRILLRQTYSTGESTAYAIRFERQANGRYKERPGRDDERIAMPGIAPTIVTREEQMAVATRLATNQQFASRNNKRPQLALLRAGIARCGYCGWALRVHNRDSSGHGPSYCCSSHVRGACQNPAIRASILDGAVWAKVVEILRDPQIIAAEVAKHREDGGLERDLASVEKMLAGIVSKQTRTVKAITTIDDDEAATPLIEELKGLSARKIAAEQERESLKRRIVDAAADAARLNSLADWCNTVNENLKTLTYDQKRLAIEALGIGVRLWRMGATDEAGEPLPRWMMTMAPSDIGVPVVLHGTCSTRAGRHPRGT